MRAIHAPELEIPAASRPPLAEIVSNAAKLGALFSPQWIVIIHFHVIRPAFRWENH